MICDLIGVRSLCPAGYSGERWSRVQKEDRREGRTHAHNGLTE